MIKNRGRNEFENGITSLLVTTPTLLPDASITLVRTCDSEYDFKALKNYFLSAPLA